MPPCFLRGELTVTEPMFPIWKTIKLGTYKDVKSLREGLEKNGFRNGDWSADVGTKPAFTLATEEATINLVNVSVGELGFTKATPLRDICTRAIVLGLKSCPAEVGPQLRLQYPDQPLGQWVHVAMEAITDSGSGPYAFGVGRNSFGRHLSTHWSNPDNTLFPGDRLIFCQ